MQPKSTSEVRQADITHEDGSNCIRRVMWVTPVSLAVWTLILWLNFR